MLFGMHHAHLRINAAPVHCPTIGGQYFATNGVLSPYTTANGGYLDHSLKAKQRSHQAYARVATT